MDISEIISELSRHERIPNSLETKKLLIQLAMWMRFPSDADMQRTAVFYASTIYAKETWGDLPISDFSEAKKNFILSGVRLSHLIYGQYNIVIPDFELSEYTGEFCLQNEFDYVANIVKFIFWYNPRSNNIKTPNARQIASLNKAFLFMAWSGFGKPMEMTRASGMKRWRALHAAAPFHYVDIAEFNGNFRLNPQADPKVFVETLDRLAARSERIREFLQKCHTAVETLRQKLHPRALEKKPLPNFPDGFPQVPLAVVELPDDVRDLVQSKKFKDGPSENEE